MTFFEFSFRIKVLEENVFPVIEGLYPRRSVLFYPHAQFYNEEKKCPPQSCCFVYEFLYSAAGFGTFFKGEIDNEEQVSELSLALSFATKLKTEVVIGDFTCKSSFLLITTDEKIYRAESIGIGNDQNKADVFELNYHSLSSAIDLEDASGPFF
jgi:hypothetical protein